MAIAGIKRNLASSFMLGLVLLNAYGTDSVETSFGFQQSAHSKISNLDRCEKSFIGRPMRSEESSIPSSTKDEDSDERNNNDIYHLKLTNTGPVILDSILDFRAQMFDNKGHIEDPKIFLYTWQNDATYKDLRTINGFEANLTHQVFSSNIDPQQYTMQVCVYGKQTLKKEGLIKYTRVAHGKTKFKLTKSLNGISYLTQGKDRDKYKTIFATNETVKFVVNITDRFLEKTESIYFWYKDDVLVKSTSTPEYHFKVTEPKTVKLSVSTILKNWYSNRLQGKRISFNQTENLRFSRYDFPAKNGSWFHRASFKDKIESVHVTCRNTTQIDQNLKMNVTFTGSGPMFVCWNVWNETSVVISELCSDALSSNDTLYVIDVNFTCIGTYNVNISLQNDVSSVLRHVNHIQVQDQEPSPDPLQPSSGPGFTVPTIFICIGVLIVIIGTVFAVRARKKPQVEVADFDFHPHLHRDQSHPLITWSKGLFSAVFRSDKYKDNHYHPNYRKTTARSYGATGESELVL